MPQLGSLGSVRGALGNQRPLYVAAIGTRTWMGVSGAVGAKYHSSGTDTVSDTDVVGAGEFVVGPGFYPSGLRFGGYVSAGQSVDIGGLIQFPSVSVPRLEIDLPTQFHGTFDLHDFSLADLVGLARAARRGSLSKLLRATRSTPCIVSCRPG